MRAQPAVVQPKLPSSGDGAKAKPAAKRRRADGGDLKLPAKAVKILLPIVAMTVRSTFGLRSTPLLMVRTGRQVARERKEIELALVQAVAQIKTKDKAGVLAIKRVVAGIAAGWKDSEIKTAVRRLFQPGLAVEQMVQAPQLLVGQRLHVFWPGDEQWCPPLPLAALTYDSVGVFGAALQEKIGVFHSSLLRMVPKTPTASYALYCFVAGPHAGRANRYAGRVGAYVAVSEADLTLPPMHRIDYDDGACPRTASLSWRVRSLLAQLDQNLPWCLRERQD